MPPKRHSPQKRACDVCYRRKIQCSFTDSGSPCDWCNHRDLDCTFDRAKPTRKRKRGLESSTAQSLHARNEQPEEVPARTRSTQEPITPVASNTNTPQDLIVDNDLENDLDNDLDSDLPQHTHHESSYSSSILSEPRDTGINVSANQLGPNWFFNGISISSASGLSWIASRTDQRVTEMDFSLSIRELPFSTLEPLNFHDPLELPDENITRLRLDVLSSELSCRLKFPILDLHLIDKTLKVSYEPVHRVVLSTRHLAARACVFAFISLAPLVKGRLEDIGFEGPKIDGDLCAAKAHHLLMYLTGDMSLETLQAVMCLQLISIFNGHWQGAAFLHSIACRIVCSLGGHVDKPIQSAQSGISPEDRETRHIRFLFWVCYMLDKDISLRTGSPPILTDLDCDLTSPDSTLSRLAPPGRSPVPSETSSTLILLSDPRLSMLKEKVYRQLFSARALKESDNQFLLHVRHLDEEIESWRLSIPSAYRPALFVWSARRSGIMVPQGHTLQRMSLQLEYHHLMIIIHTTIRKCTADTPDAIRDLHEVAHSSFDLSLEASRSTFLCLQVLNEIKVPDTIWFISLYSTTAALSLFLNIVIHPYDPQARIDLETLMSAANRIRDMRVDSKNRSEVDLAREISDFIMRLVWLGTCAVTKVERDKR